MDVRANQSLFLDRIKNTCTGRSCIPGGTISGKEGDCSDCFGGIACGGGGTVVRAQWWWTDGSGGT